MFFIYHQHVVQCLDISIYHIAMKIIRWWSTYHSTQLTLTQWTFQHQSSKYGNSWRTIGTRPSCINWLMFLQFLLLTYTSTWSKNNRPILPFNLADESVDDTAHIWTLFSHTRIYIFLVPTCHLSVSTFSIRFFVTYYCGWWYTDSIHLQKWQQGWRACYKISWESWPAYEMGTYTDGESPEATNTIQISSWIWTIGYKTQNPWNPMSTIIYCKT